MKIHYTSGMYFPGLEIRQSQHRVIQGGEEVCLPAVGNLGTDGVFLAEPISNLIGGTACFTTMMITVWRRLRDETNKR